MNRLNWASRQISKKTILVNRPVNGSVSVLVNGPVNLLVKEPINLPMNGPVKLDQ